MLKTVARNRKSMYLSSFPRKLSSVMDRYSRRAGVSKCVIAEIAIRDFFESGRAKDIESALNSERSYRKNLLESVDEVITEFL